MDGARTGFALDGGASFDPALQPTLGDVRERVPDIHKPLEILDMYIYPPALEQGGTVGQRKREPLRL